MSSGSYTWITANTHVRMTIHVNIEMYSDADGFFLK